MRVLIGLALLAACTSGPAPEPGHCGDTRWRFAIGPVTNDAFVAGTGCFAVDESEGRVTFRIPVGARGSCTLAGTRNGAVVALDTGSCVASADTTSSTGAFHRWRITGGTATALDAGGWALRAEFEVVLLTHDAAFEALDVQVGTGTIDHDGTTPGEVLFDRSWGHPCTPAATYTTSVSGRVAKSEGASTSCEALLADLGPTHSFTYSFDAGHGRVSYGEDAIPYALLPEACVVVFDESSDAWQSRLDLDARTVTIRTRQAGPFVQEHGTAQCELKWTGTLSAP